MDNKIYFNKKHKLKENKDGTDCIYIVGNNIANFNYIIKKE